MTAVAFDPHHQALAVNFSLLLSGRQPSGPVLLAAEQLERWALADPDLGFTPTSPVNAQGQCLAQVVVGQAVAEEATAQWVRGWVGRHGTACLYPDTIAQAGNPLESLMQQVLGQAMDKGSLADMAGHMAVLEALVDLAPDSALDAGKKEHWVEQLTLLEDEHAAILGGPEAQLKVLDALERRLPSDPGLSLHTARRWVGHDRQKHFTDAQRLAPVRAPSGRVRRLGELLVPLPVATGEGAIRSPSALPDIPADLGEDALVPWVLASPQDLDTVRQRAWALALHRPESFARLMDWAGAPGADREQVKRARQGLSLRDGLGRSLSAFLAIRQPGLLESARRAGLASPQDLVATDGQGLLSQALRAGREGWAMDAFDDPWNLSPTDFSPPQAWLDDTTDDLVDDLVDQAVLGRRSLSFADTVLRVLQQAGHGQAEKLRQAITWGRFHQEVAHLSQSSRYQDRAAQHLAGLVQHVAAHGMLLDIGMVEWRQWAVLRRDWPPSAHLQVLEDALVACLERADSARGLDAAWPAAGARGGRARM